MTFTDDILQNIVLENIQKVTSVTMVEVYSTIDYINFSEGILTLAPGTYNFNIHARWTGSEESHAKINLYKNSVSYKTDFTINDMYWESSPYFNNSFQEVIEYNTDYKFEVSRNGGSSYVLLLLFIEKL